MSSQLPKRKPTRLKDFDYSTNGAYFITICTEKRVNILSQIVGEGLPLPQLSDFGSVADRWINKIPEKYNEVTLDNYVIMPNHIHLLLSVSGKDGRGDPSPTMQEVVGWLKYQITKEINSIRSQTGTKIFQRSFFDHIIRNDTDYTEIYNYICENPLRWNVDKLYNE